MSTRVIDCRTEYKINPLGIHELKPRLYWKLASDEYGAMQSAYRIQVASAEALLTSEQADMWDSGKIESAESIAIPYEGKQLLSEASYYWRVKVWDQAGRESEWSAASLWSMGVLKRYEWKAKWIGKKPEVKPNQVNADIANIPPYFRRSFESTKAIKRAFAYATALGVYELNINGQKISDIFAPGWTDYNVRSQVQAYDITSLLQQGENVLSVVLGDGWYSGTVGFLGKHVYGERPFISMQARIEYEDGSSELIVTDEQWKVTTGPLLYSDMIKGEAYDARLELTGYDLAGYDDSAWESPDTRPGYNGLLTATLEPPIKVTEQLRAISVKRTASGSYIFDMGQNMVGWTKLKVQGEAGTKITISHAEMLDDNDGLYLDNLRVAVQQDHYILKGEGIEYYEPSFTFHGYRYVELIGYPEEPTLDTIVGQVVHSDTVKTGSLQTSNTMVNQLYSNITWGQRGNFLSVPTDCPQRDERLGWTGDAQIFARTASYNMDVADFFTKFYQDMLDCQQPSGAFTDVAPDAGWIRHKMWNTRLNWYAPDNSGWGDAGVIIPWTMYLMYGDEKILAEHYDASVRWIDYLYANSEELVRPGYANYADWLSIGADTPNEVLATAYFAYSTKLVAKIAKVLNKPDDVLKYESLFNRICAAFRKAFVDEQGKIFGHTQTVYVLALQFGLLTDELKDKAIAYLVQDIRDRGNRLSTGFLGVGYLLPVLTDHGQQSLAYDLLLQEQFPSWMYSIKHGATTIWERWDGWTEEKGFQTPSMNSFNHYSLGSVGEWMFRYMAGIDVNEEKSAFRAIDISPRPDPRITEVKSAYESLFGAIAVHWKYTESGKLEYNITIPPNTTATLRLPHTVVDTLAGQAAVVTRIESETTVIGVGAGRYSFLGH